ncbi:unnamed protein product [Dovyalis caffra]|uniref:Uncharacterized protein n=1 Tax=Dovyalis caffra TaxID=77055 RepID=A0AAV1R8E6_9ROSI|nr:unnamed protein product [Dovyalis caffra]
MEGHCMPEERDLVPAPWAIHQHSFPSGTKTDSKSLAYYTLLSRAFFQNSSAPTYRVLSHDLGPWAEGFHASLSSLDWPMRDRVEDVIKEAAPKEGGAVGANHLIKPELNQPLELGLNLLSQPKSYKKLWTEWDLLLRAASAYASEAKGHRPTS